MSKKMQFKYFLSLVGILTIIATTKLNVEGRRLKLRPLLAPEVYRILKEAGREDAVPEGRVVTQGIAAITGFNLGLATGIGGALLYDLITANATVSSSTNSSTSSPSFITQDICFQSRSLESDKQVRNVENDESESGRQTSPTTTNPSTTPTVTTGTTATTPTQTGTPPGTQTDTGEDQTCITIQKPKARKRRSTDPQKKDSDLV